MITRIRAWLIALVREAIREESAAKDAAAWTALTTYPGRPQGGQGTVFSGVTKEAWDRTNKHVVPSKVNPEPSFERMQDEALQEQEKYDAEQSIG